MHYHFTELASTNKYAKAQINNLENFDYITCGRQTNGYGVSGAWDGQGQNVYYTLVIKQDLVDAQTLPFCILLSMAQVIKHYGPGIYIKLPNDVYHDGKKLAGFLIEQAQDFYLVGIGININAAPPEFAFLQQLHDAVISLPVVYEQLTNTIIDNLKVDPQTLLAKIKPHVKIIGQQVTYLNKETQAVTTDLCLDVNFQTITLANETIEIIKYKELK